MSVSPVLAVLLACAPPSLVATAELDAGGLTIHANRPLTEVRVRQGGTLVTVVQPDATDVVVRAPLGDAPVQVELSAGLERDTLELEPSVTGPYTAWLEIPLGQGRTPDGADVERGVRGGLVVQARQDVQLSWQLPEAGGAELAAGERVVVPFEVHQDVEVRVEGGGRTQTLTATAVEPVPVDLAMQVRFPVDSSGDPDATAPTGRIRLPAPWWDAVLDRFGLGFRPRSDQAPIGLLGVQVDNPSERAVNALITARFPHPAFRPRLRDQTRQDRVSRLVRLSPGETRATLPVYLDRSALPTTTSAPVEVELRLLGAAGPHTVQTYPLVVERGSRWASAVVGLGLLGGLAGWLALLVRGRRWLARPTPELTTIAMFGALGFTVGLASQVLGLGIATVLGPFAPFVVGLFDDAVRMCLAATLLMLVPRVGVASVALLVGWLMRAVVLGAAHPVDLLYLGSAIATQEAALWISGVTRVGRLAWWRLVVGLALPHAWSALLSLAVSSVVYRLYYAEWYVVAVVLVPGLLYAMLGCALAVPFAPEGPVSAVELDDVSWSWEGGSDALQRVSLRIESGEHVLITGASGSGKSTLLQLLAGLLPAHGRGKLSGTLRIEGEDPGSWSPRQRARRIGYVQQEPHHQLVASTVGEEVAFAAVQTDQEPPALQLDLPPHAPTAELSGGQCQRVAAAAAQSAGAPLLLLDEPLAHLDPLGVRSLLEGVRGTVVLVEHRLEAALSWADRLVVLDEGRVVWDGPVSPAGLGSLVFPPMQRVEQAGGLDALGPRRPRVHVRSGGFEIETPMLARNGVQLWAARRWWIAAGDRIALVGPNGAGKSTALEALAKALGNRAVWIPQQPELSLFAADVRAEVRYGPEERGLDEVPKLEHFGLDGLETRHPLALSKGQQLRVAVAAGLAAQPDVLLLDEPTAGQHLEAVHQVFEALDRTLGERALVFATHDLELALRWATHVVVVGGPEGPPHLALQGMPLPPLQAAQAARGWPLTDVEQQLSGPAGEVGEVVVPGRVEAPQIPRPERPPLRPLHLVLLGTVGTLAVLLDRPAALGLLALLGLVFLFTRRVPVRPVLLVLAGVVWSTVLSQGLFYGDRPRVALLELGPIVLWREGLLWGAVQSLRLVAVSAVGLGIALGTSAQGLAGLLQRVRVPRALAFLTSLAVQAVPGIGRSWWTARTARARRGRPIWRRSPWAMVRTEVAMLVPVVHRAVRQGRVLARSLDARGFTLDRSAVHPPLTTADRIALLAGLGIVGLVMGLQSIEAAYRWEIFYDPALRPLYAWVRQWL